MADTKACINSKCNTELVKLPEKQDYHFLASPLGKQTQKDRQATVAIGPSRSTRGGANAGLAAHSNPERLPGREIATPVKAGSRGKVKSKNKQMMMMMILIVIQKLRTVNPENQVIRSERIPTKTVLMSQERKLELTTDRASRVVSQGSVAAAQTFPKTM